MPVSSIVIEYVTAATDEIRSLIGELDRELSVEYPPEQRHGLTLDAIFQPHIRFFMARLDGAPIGCGGIALYSGFAEVKRMYVRNAARGQGAADAILRTLERAAMDEGRSILRLETGTRQFRALSFYQRSGFTPCDAFEPYASMPIGKIATSLFMEKPLSLSSPGNPR